MYAKLYFFPFVFYLVSSGKIVHLFNNNTFISFSFVIWKKVSIEAFMI